jgi:hypothetical protein
MKPACVLVAAGLGADTDLPHEFDTKHWLLAPTDDMEVYQINDEMLSQLVAKVEAEHGEH